MDIKYDDTMQEWDTMINLYGDLVYRIAFQNMKNKSDAEDVSQDVYLKLLKKMPRGLNKNEQKAWIIRVTINTCKDYWRYHKRHRTIELIDDLDTLEQDKKDYQIIFKVRELPLKYRSVIYLHYYEQLSVKEISQILKKKEATILTWLHRGRKLLKSKLEGENENETI